MMTETRDAAVVGVGELVFSKISAKHYRRNAIDGKKAEMANIRFRLEKKRLTAEPSAYKKKKSKKKPNSPAKSCNKRLAKLRGQNPHLTHHPDSCIKRTASRASSFLTPNTVPTRDTCQRKPCSVTQLTSVSILNRQESSSHQAA
ncbi:hypothetical protein CEXT_731321 [Caerostris extrusa]|uniref:Uncharacterized protein n=1 Tax=Caerostris extrusa TaxID=172846 RepID=A0AAV4X554_CAEEX|nr:hypothetical protein CEXT_731321 [Caerostris extrusa]